MNNKFSMELADVPHYRLYNSEYKELLSQIKNISNREVPISELKFRTLIINKWSEETLITNLFYLEKLKVLKITTNTEHPILRYRFEINENYLNAFRELTKATFKINLNYTKEEWIIFLKEIESECYDKEFEKLIKYWEKEELQFLNHEERVLKLKSLHTKYYNEYFSDTNVLGIYCVHKEDELVEFLFKKSKYIDLPKNPNQFFSSFEPINELKEAIYVRYKQIFQFQTLSHLLQQEKSPEELFLEFKNESAKEFFEYDKAEFIRENPKKREVELTGQLRILEEFIEKAEKINIITAKEKNRLGYLINNENEHIYSRLKNGYYQENEIVNILGSKEAFIYGKYFLFYDWLKEQVQLINELKVVEDEPNQTKNTDSFMLKKTDDLAVYRYFLGELNIKSKINLDNSNISKNEYDNEIKYFEEKYPNVNLILKSVCKSSGKINEEINNYEDKKEFNDENKMTRILKRVKKQLIIEYPKTAPLIESHFNKYKI